jgi:hypothetical protein
MAFLKKKEDSLDFCSKNPQQDNKKDIFKPISTANYHRIQVEELPKNEWNHQSALNITNDNNFLMGNLIFYASLFITF